METGDHKHREYEEDTRKWIYNEKGLQELRKLLEWLEQHI